MKKTLLTILLFFITSFAHADPYHAVGRLISHGGSLTVISTTNGKSWLLSCGHCFPNRERNKPVKIDMPVPELGQTTPFHIDNRTEQIGTAKTVGIKVVAVDHSLDLSLLEMNFGPLPYVAPVAPLDWKVNDTLLSCGYDEMQPGGVGKPQTYQVHVLRQEQYMTYTKEPPWHGRSGGGLLDGEYTVGVCHAYTVEPRKKGMYVSLKAIHRFLQNNGHADLIANAGTGTPEYSPPAADRPQQYGDINIPENLWVANRSGSQCGWCALKTLADFHKISRLSGLTQEHFNTTGPSEVEAVLRKQNVFRAEQSQGNMDTNILLYAMEKRVGCMVGLGGKHCVVLVGLEGNTMHVIDNQPPAKVSIPLSNWDGWAVILWPDEVGEAWERDGKKKFIGDYIITAPVPAPIDRKAPLPNETPKTNPNLRRAIPRAFRQPDRPDCPT